MFRAGHAEGEISDVQVPAIYFIVNVFNRISALPLAFNNNVFQALFKKFALHAKGDVNVYISYADIMIGNYFWNAELMTLQGLLAKGAVKSISVHIFDNKYMQWKKPVNFNSLEAEKALTFMRMQRYKLDIEQFIQDNPDLVKRNPDLVAKMKKDLIDSERRPKSMPLGALKNVVRGMKDKHDIKRILKTRQASKTDDVEQRGASQAKIQKSILNLFRSSMDDSMRIMKGLESGDPDVLRVVQNDPVWINKIYPNGLTPLTLFVMKEDLKALEALMSGGLIDINKKNRNGETVLMVAVAKGNLKIITKILDTKGLDIFVKDSNHKTVLDKLKDSDHPNKSDIMNLFESKFPSATRKDLR